MVKILKLWFNLLKICWMKKASKEIHSKLNLSLSDDFVSSNEAFKLVFQNAAIAILILKDGLILDCNSKSEELFDCTRDYLINKSLVDLSPEYQPNGILSSVKFNEITLNNYDPSPVITEWVLRGKDKTQFIAKISFNTFNLNGEYISIVFIDDISKLKQSIAELNIYKSDLEGLVAERNKELFELNQKLSLTVEELNATNLELININEELSKTLKTLNREVNIRKELHNLLIINQEKFKSFVDQSADGISIVEIDGSIVEWNKALTDITGISFSEASRSNIYELNFRILPEALRTDENFQRIEKEISYYIENIEKQTVRVLEGEVQLTNGDLKYISTIVFPIKLAKKYLIGRITRDITQLKTTEQELNRYRKNLEEIINAKTNEISKLSSRYIEIFNNTSDAIAIISKDFKLLEANPALKKILNQSNDELYRGDILESIPESYHPLVKNSIELLLNGELLNNIEIEIINSNGEKIPVELSANIIDFNNEKALLSIIRNIKERRETEKLILRTTIEAEERERRRLAADLHDDIGPLLASLKMYISIIQQKLQGTPHSEVINIIQNLIKSSIENVRTISNNISPHLIERFGLISAIYAEIENLKLLILIDFKTNSSGFKFEKQVEIIVYRIIKELINNTLKYASATNISLSINYHNSKLYIEFSDNGIGFDLSAITLNKNSGHGLNNIDNRIRSINGNYSIDTSKGKGIVFKLVAPVNLR